MQDDTQQFILLQSKPLHNSALKGALDISIVMNLGSPKTRTDVKDEAMYASIEDALSWKVKFARSYHRF